MRALAIVLSIALSATAGAQDIKEEKVTLPNVTIRAGITTPITVTTFSRGVCKRSALAIPGLLHSAATWRPLAEAFLRENERICRVYALDLPGQGESPLPSALSYSAITLSDLVTVIDEVICELSRDQLISTIVAHSQGALLVQLLQQSLIARNESVRGKFGVTRVVFLAPVSGEPIPWYFPTTARFRELLSNAIMSDEARGAHITISSELWSSLFFSRLDGTIPAGVPSSEEVDRYRVTAPLVSTLELLGYPPYRRPRIEPGIFAPRYRTRLTLVAFAQDPFIGLGEVGQLYLHLTDDAKQRRLVVMEGDDTVHDLHLVAPERVVQSIRRPAPLALRSVS